EDGDRAVRLVGGRAHEGHAVGDEPPGGAPEVVGLDEREDPAARLMADGGAPPIGGGPRQQDARASPAGRAPAPPTRAVAEVGVFDAFESQLVDVEPERLVVVAHHDGELRNVLAHGAPAYVVSTARRYSPAVSSGCAPPPANSQTDQRSAGTRASPAIS